MKRITVWVDSKTGNSEELLKKLKVALNKNGFQFTILSVCDIKESEDSK